MNKVIFLVFASMLFFACSNDEQMPDVQTQGGVVFEISAESHDLTKGTALYSSEAPQNISSVNIYVFNAGLYQETYAVSNWSTTTNSGSYTVSAPLLSGTYQFLAVGREASDGFTLPTLSVGVTTPADMEAALSAVGTAYDLFSGTTTTTLAGTPTIVSVVMTRRVGGFLGYFTNIPQILDGDTVATLRVTASTGNQTVLLTDGSGSDPAAGYDIMTVNLSSQTVTNGIYAGNAVGGGVAQLANSQLGGGYLLPTDNVTLTVGLYDKNGAVIKSWTVMDGASNTIDIMPGQFYSIGTKEIASNTTGDDPDDDTDNGDPSDDDKGLSLLEGQIINVTLDPAWGTLHELTLQSNP